jgi:dynein heavy chain
MKKPVKAILSMMQAIALIKSNFDKHPMTSIPDTWPFYQKILNDVKLLAFLKESPTKLEGKPMSEGVLKLVNPYLSDPLLDPVHMETKISFACGAFASYIKNMVELDKVIKEKLIPSKLDEELATKTLNEAQKNLEETLANLKIIEDKLDQLQKSFDEKQMEKNNLQFEINESMKKLGIAQRLTSKLSGEMTRWGENATNLDKGKKFVFGNIIISAFYISFMGPYLSHYRESVVKKYLFPLINEVFTVYILNIEKH